MLPAPSATVPSSRSTGRSRYSKIRSNSAPDVWMSMPTDSSWPMGKKSRVCSVVNATTVPIEIALAPVVANGCPASQ